MTTSDDRWSTVTARTTSIGVQGRAISAAGKTNVIVDDGAANEGPGEEATPTELFLAGVTSCAVLLISRLARGEGIALAGAEAVIEAKLDKEFGPDGPRTFDSIRLTITLRGVGHDEADTLVAGFKARCPLYGSLALAVPDTVVDLVVAAVAAVA